MTVWQVVEDRNSISEGEEYNFSSKFVTKFDTEKEAIDYLKSRIPKPKDPSSMFFSSHEEWHFTNDKEITWSCCGNRETLRVIKVEGK